MTLDAAQFGLRERKRLATKRAIELSALELVAEKGLDKVTVDEISHIAGVSPRTFFNYFASKESAIVGDTPELPTDDQLRDYVNAGSSRNVLQDLGPLLAHTTDLTSGDSELQMLRRSLLKQYPQLFALRMTAMRNFEEQLREVVSLRLALDEPELAADADALESKARLITLVAFGVVRHAWTCWAGNEGGEPLSERLLDSFDQLPALLAPADAA